MKSLIVTFGLLFCLSDFSMVLAQGIRAVTRRTPMQPAPGFFLLPGRPVEPVAAPAQAGGGGVLLGQRANAAERAPRLARPTAPVIIEDPIAAQRAAGAQYALALRYLSGNGVRKDYGQGRRWLESAAANGHEAAARLLERWERMEDQ